MRRSLSGFVAVVCALTGIATTQGIAEGIAAAQLQIEEQEWKTALEVLLGLQDKVTTDAEAGELAKKLDEVGECRVDATGFTSGLRAHEASLAIRQRLHGDTDHADVASSLNKEAFCHSAG